MGVFQIGPFIIKFTLLFIILAGIITYYILKKMLHTDIQFREEFLDASLHAVFIGVISYKASVYLLRPELWIENPLGALALRGSWREMFIGGFLALSSIIWKCKKLQWHPIQMIKAFLYGAVSFILSYWFIRTTYLIISSM